ncbi:lipid-A-disaccharide synthase N-terminal domain-containing protein [Rhodovulum sulfidophilum]|uniref:Lipid A biosynthesis protein n=1 Tax=Rhodovulum sulfidophilum TaxID=35806 RepID=A0A0D6AX05_RHOSU|nr:lipid-A-disaccharide synthase N-terminal domain-containing protein [Rhodovulum sulfidophilum]ANB33471.1 lipid A biosynthesis protein [Rhodovulum sulfidophilum DSM 1374]ANB37292.1 lipid A biosynthesis protein [Rhodovulum sulfidophilum]MBK5922225.1 lipid A biosynthesis protein [Rhodovulum sulfidophilum]MBL3553831.1 lipid-A-disaccharide synthase N-terminal domain-containing protein [Rhodovulum sulfidophilum]MBL3560965.1 lipid-A-disaccharide synthase N-terminal domain-containing protein [Rhodov
MAIETVFGWLHVHSWVEFWWVVVGLGGQLMFTARFLVQWIASERARNSVVPVAFWYFSMAGGLILLAYAIYRKDPVFILGQVTGVFIYTRNLWLIHAHRRRNA